MKKITLTVACLLFGGIYFANAQVGIGTPQPNVSAQLEIVAKDKGVLIPRVLLTSLTDYTPIDGAATESLLVYNLTATAPLSLGFYYWSEGKWNKIVNQTDLDNAIVNLGADLTNIKNLLNYIVPTNPGNTGGTNTQPTTIVYNPATGAISYVTYEGGNYTTTTLDLSDLIQGLETKTFFKKVESVGAADNATNAKYYYFSEEAIQNWLSIAGNTDLTTMPVTAAGVFEIDAVGDVLNNFESILNQSINYQGNATTIKNIINEIASKSEGNVIYKNIAAAGDPANWVFQYWDGTSYQTITIGDLVQSNETNTFIRTVLLANGNTQYVYFSEKAIKDWLAAGASNTVANIPDNAPGAIVIDATSDVVNNFESILNQSTTYNNESKTIQEIINEIAGKIEGNVIYKNIGTAGAPQWAFQYWDGNTYQTITLADLVQANETTTVIVAIIDASNKVTGFKYFNEAEVKAFIAANTGSTSADITAQTPGGVSFDIVGTVVNNFQEILDGKTTVLIPGGGGDFYTVSQLIQSLSKEVVGNVIYENTAASGQPENWVFKYFNGTTHVEITMGDLVASNETKTRITRAVSGTSEIIYSYAHEANKPDSNGIATVGDADLINVTADMVASITNNTEVQNAIHNVLRAGGNVYFTATAVDAVDNDGVAIPANSLYTVDATGKKTLIDISGNVLNVINQNAGDIKVLLGDKITNNTVVNTGDTLEGKAIFKFKGRTIIAANSARTSGVNLPAGAAEVGVVVSIKVLYSNGITANVTDVVVAPAKIDFNIGTGNMYNILNPGTYDVIVEYAEN